MVLDFFFKWFSQKKENITIVDGIYIPSGFTDLNTWLKNNPRKTPNQETIRYLSGKKNQPFVFDENNPEYLSFLAQLREDTKILRKALSKELKKRTLPFLGAQTPLSKKKKAEYWKISLLIRPPFFSSDNSKNPENRWQATREDLDFILHYDQNHTLESVRYYNKSNNTQNIRLFKQKVGEAIWKQKAAFQQKAYGNWELIAKVFTDILEENIHILEPEYTKEAA